ncbi:hypothetical protein J1614_003288 [Plenodomus biglobosus]|nr:hypothetical protein J1614_003288 [Plenodomus biglobosus]
MSTDTRNEHHEAKPDQNPQWVEADLPREQEWQILRIRDNLLKCHPQLASADLELRVKRHSSDREVPAFLDVRWSECSKIYGGDLQFQKSSSQATLDFAEEQCSNDLGLFNTIVRGRFKVNKRLHAHDIAEVSSLNIEESKTAMEKITEQECSKEAPAIPNAEDRGPEKRLTLDPDDASENSPYKRVQRIKEKLTARFPTLREENITLHISVQYALGEVMSARVDLIVVPEETRKRCQRTYLGGDIPSLLSNAEKSVASDLRWDQIVGASSALAAQEERTNVRTDASMAAERLERHKEKLIKEGRISKVEM